MENNFKQLVSRAQKQSLKLAASSAEFRNSVLNSMLLNLQRQKSEILSANQKDQEIAKDLLAKKQLSNALFQRMRLDQSKYTELAAYPALVSKLVDPVRQLQYHCTLDKGLTLKRYTVPLGVLLVIFESRPEVLVQISSLAIKSGNAVLLKGGCEAKNTNRALFAAIRESLLAYEMEGLVCLLETRHEVKELLKEKAIDLVIPRGSNQLVQYIQNNTKIPVMGHADGICHTYIDQKADETKVIPIVVDGKCEYPTACNATETLLLHKNIAQKLVVALLRTLRKNKVELRIAQSLTHLAKQNNISYKLAKTQDWQTEYTDKILAIKEVDSTSDAIAHINLYGSQHTDTIVTEDQAAAEQFFQQVDSAGVFHNASTRFADGRVYGLGAEVGISTGKLHARGPVGLEGLMTYKYILSGQGQIRASYKGEKAINFMHLIHQVNEKNL